MEKMMACVGEGDRLSIHLMKEEEEAEAAWLYKRCDSFPDDGGLGKRTGEDESK